MEVVHVIVVGCGRVGAGLAIRLTEQGHGVSIIDRVSQSFHRLPDDWPGEKVVGSGFNLDDLNAAGASAAGGLAAVTSGDNTNIVTARIAREHYGIANVVALGALARLSRLCAGDSLEEAVRLETPAKFAGLNLAALREGFDLAGLAPAPAL